MGDIILTSDLQSELGSESESESGSGSESNTKIQLEITEYNNKTKKEKTYVVKYGTGQAYLNSNRKKLLCFSVIKNEYCHYGDQCTYAHNLFEQIIELENLYVYQIILDAQLMNFFSLLNPKTEQIYKKLVFYTTVCDKCVASKCMGGYNCKHGVHDKQLKICKNDLLTGQCINNTSNINVCRTIIHKINQIDPIQPPEKYIGCIMGHHLSTRNLIPYYTYIADKEYSKKTTYQSVRYINSHGLTDISKNNLFYKGTKTNNPINKSRSNSTTESESTDEEISGWFDKKKFLNSESGSGSDSNSDLGTI